MKITVKTLQQKVFQVNGPLPILHRSISSLSQIDAESTDTVGDLKNKIQDTQGHATSSQKIIYSGEIILFVSQPVPKLIFTRRENPS